MSDTEKIDWQTLYKQMSEKANRLSAELREAQNDVRQLQEASRCESKRLWMLEEQLNKLSAEKLSAKPKDKEQLRELAFTRACELMRRLSKECTNRTTMVEELAVLHMYLRD